MKYFVKRKNIFELISHQILNLCKVEKNFVPFYLKTPKNFDTIKFFNKLSESINQVQWIFLSDVSYQFIVTAANVKFFNLQSTNSLEYINYLKNVNASKKSIILVIDESHKDLTEELFKQFFLPANPKIILKISSSPFESKADEKIFVKSLSVDNPGCYLVI